ncbi:MAG: hypothetical protein DSY58_01105, partial [Desulfobulbus sp.]
MLLPFVGRVIITDEEEGFMNIRIIGAFIALGALFTYVLPADAVEFPGRQKAKYKNVQPIEIEALYNDYVDGKVNII